MNAPGATLRPIAASGDDRDGPIHIRGRTTLADRVVERIAAHAVTEVDDVGGSARRILGLAVGSAGLDHAAQVSAQIKGETVVVHVWLSVVYPASVAHTTERVRGHLTRRIQELTGLAMPRLDITVTALHNSEINGRRVQ